MVSQQKGSRPQTWASQAGSSQPVPSWASQQGPGGGPAQSAQRSPASPTQMPSQPTSQQKGSTAQTVASQAGSTHPGSSLGVVQQSLGVGAPQSSGHSSSASSAQIWSQAVSQQKASTAHTADSHSPSLQPGVPWASQQSPSSAQPGIGAKTHSPLPGSQ